MPMSRATARSDSGGPVRRELGAGDVGDLAGDLRTNPFPS